MSVKRNAMRYGAAAAVLALAIIAGSAFLVYNQSQSTTGTTQLQGSQGQLDVLLTDPPSVPAGVTAVFVTYTDVGVHVSGAGNQSGWTTVDTTGTIDLMKLVNVSSTIATVKVASGTYDALRFNVSSSEVTYNGKNYTAFVPRAELFVAIQGGINVSAAKSSAAIIDMSPTVVNIGSSSDPEFIVSTAASSFGLPSSAVTPGMDRLRFRMSLNGSAWWNQGQQKYNPSIEITSATLSGDSLSVTVKNTGTVPVSLGTLSVTPLEGSCAFPFSSNTTTTYTYTGYSHSRMPHGFGFGHGGLRVPQCFSGSALFGIASNGTLSSVSGWQLSGPRPVFNLGQRHQDVFASPGYSLAANQSTTLTFSGTISFGLSFQGMAPGATQPGVVSGQQYDITILGQQIPANIVVVAS